MFLALNNRSNVVSLLRNENSIIYRVVRNIEIRIFFRLKVTDNLIFSFVPFERNYCLNTLLSLPPHGVLTLLIG